MKRCLCMLLTIVMLFASVSTGVAEAATKKAAPAYKGKWTYYAVDNTIYKMDSKTGKVKTVKKIKNAFEVGDISCSGGYLYFTENDYYGTDSTENYVCRMKTNGSGYKKLAHGDNPIIYGKKIYYISIKHVSGSDMEYDERKGVSCMSLTGKGSKLLVRNNSEESYLSIGRIAVAAGKIFYTQNIADKGCLIAYDLKHANKKTVYSLSEPGLNLVNTDGTYVYLGMQQDWNETAYIYNTKTGKMRQAVLGKEMDIIAGRNGIIYCSNYEKNATYAYQLKNNKMTTILKNKNVSDMIFSKYGYQLVRMSLSQEEFEASGYRYDMAVARMKWNGKSFKILKKYYVS